MRGCARRMFVWLALSAGVCLAGCSSPDGLSEVTNGWLIGKDPGAQAVPEATHSIPLETKVSEKKKKPARKPKHLTVARPKPASLAPAQPAEPPAAADPKHARPQSPGPELRLRTLWPDAPTSGMFSR